MNRILSIGTAALLVLFIALPFVWTIWASLVREARLFSSTSDTTLSLASYTALFSERAFLIPLRNSLFVAAATTGLCVGLAAPAAYALARTSMRGVNIILGAVLAVSVLPQITVVGPLFLILRALKLVDTYPGLILPYTTFALPLAIWLLTGMLRAMPRDLEEAALVEGASRLRVMFEIVLPMAAPAIATTSILVFVYCWNEFLFALSFTVSPEMRTLPVAIALLRGQHQIPWGQILAAAVVTTLPVALLVLAFQKRIVGGLTAGALKG
jgi:ABC-type glycerol-3-phosphate transport system permease component